MRFISDKGCSAVRTVLGTVAIIGILWALMLPAVVDAATPQQLEKADRLRTAAADLIKEGQYKEAIKKLTDALYINPKDTDASIMLKVAKQRLVEPFCKGADEAFVSGDYDKAIGEWQKALKVSPDDIRIEKLITMTRSLMHENVLDTMYARVDSFIMEENYQAAIDELEKLLSIKPDEKRAKELLISSRQALTLQLVQKHYANAQAFFDKEDYDRAISEWQKVLELDKTQEEASRLIALTKKKRLGNRYEKAQELYEEGEYVASRAQYDKLLLENPTDEDLKKIVGNLNGTIKVVQQLRGEGLYMDMLRKALANHVSPVGNKKAAIAAAWYAEQLAPESEIAPSIREFLEREYLTVFRSMERPIQDMNIIDQYLFAALNHIYEGRYDLAVDESSIVIELDPDNTLAYKRLGSAFYALGKKAEARGAWERALEMSPDDKELKRFIKELVK
jgi:tetratricopeptide (TPR) repeat protein